MIVLEKMKSQIVSLIHSKPFIAAALFLIGLIVFESIFLSSAYSSGIVLGKDFKSANYLKAVVFIFLTVSSLVLTGLFFWVAFASSYKYRIIYFILFGFAVAVEYGYQNAFQHFTNSEDFENAFFAADWQIKINAAEMYFHYLALVPCVIFGVLLFLIKPQIKKELATLAAVFVLLCGFFTFTAYFTHNVYHTVSLGAFCRTMINFPVSWYVGTIYQPPRRIFYNEPREPVIYQAKTAPTNNIVFIVDESVRGDYLSLNGYTRQTTPFLDDLNKKGFIKNWGTAVAGATCSITSNNLLLTGLNELPDLDFKIYKLPTIFGYAKAAGYKNFYFDGQFSQFWNGKPTDIPDFGEWITAKDIEDKISYRIDIDAEIARRVREITKNSTGNFIWINKRGVHKPYENAYPNSETIWLPVSSGDDKSATYESGDDREALINNYNNAIHYNSQSFFTSLLSEGLAENTFYVYTSDHGQTLRENGAVASHCSNTKSEAIVPLFIIAEPQKLSATDTNFKASHSNIFATLLDLMDFPENERKYNYALSLFKAKAADSQPRFYFVGSLYSSEFGGKYLYDE